MSGGIPLAGKGLGLEGWERSQELTIKKEGHGQRGTSQPAMTASLVVWPWWFSFGVPLMLFEQGFLQ